MTEPESLEQKAQRGLAHAVSPGIREFADARGLPADDYAWPPIESHVHIEETTMPVPSGAAVLWHIASLPSPRACRVS